MTSLTHLFLSAFLLVLMAGSTIGSAAAHNQLRPRMEAPAFKTKGVEPDTQKFADYSLKDYLGKVRV